jgi:hypothetical protein
VERFAACQHEPIPRLRNRSSNELVKVAGCLTVTPCFTAFKSTGALPLCIPVISLWYFSWEGLPPIRQIPDHMLCFS